MRSARFTEEQRQQVIRLLTESDASVIQIAQMVGLDRQSVYYIERNQRGIKPKRKKPSPPSGGIWNPKAGRFGRYV